MRWLALLVLVPSVCFAAPSFLGICHPKYDCKGVQKLYDAHGTIILSWLENTFGSQCKCVDELLRSPKPKVIRAHLINSPCMRNKRCGRYEVLYKETAASASRKVIKADKRMMRKINKSVQIFKQRLAQSKGELTCYVSPCLECDLNGKARRILANLVSAAVPSCVLVDSPHKHRCLSRTVCEYHGDSVGSVRPCITDLDGTDGTKVDIKKWLAKGKDCDLRFYWEPWMNCNTANPSQFIDPRKRGCGTQPKPLARTQEILCQYFYPSSDTCSL